MRLASVRLSPPTPRPPALAFIHGFTQTSASWEPVTTVLGHQHSCTALDAPGHGGSPDGRRSLWQIADDVAESTDEGCVLVGYSMGARMALHAVLAHPSRFAGLVLVSGTAGIDDAAERASRRSSDEVLADRIEEVGVEAFIDEWLANPLFAGLTTGSAMRSDRLGNTAQGLADSLRHAGTGTQEPLWSRLEDISIPALIVTGSRDDKFENLGTRMASLMRSCTRVSIADAGHTVHLEKTAEFVSCVRGWLVRHFNDRASPTA